MKAAAVQPGRGGDVAQPAGDPGSLQSRPQLQPRKEERECLQPVYVPE